MTRSLTLSVALLFIFALVYSHPMSAKTDGTLIQTNVQSTTLLTPTTLTFSSRALNILAGSNYLLDDDGYNHKDNDHDWDRDRDGDKKDWDKDGDGDGDKDDRDHHHYHHEPTPEPSTLLSFGAAILIGGGVLYSRRLRKNK